MQKISAFILTFNEAEKIKAAVESVLWADEVVVIDSNSTDRTAEIAGDLGARVVQVPFAGFGDLRNRALEACRCDWIFSLDADERCTKPVRDEILGLLAGSPPHDLYRVPRRNYMMGRWIRGSGWYPNFRQPQLFRKGCMRYTLEPVHEGFENLSSKPIGTLRNAIWQIPFRNLEEIIRKMNRYSSLGAAKLTNKRVSMAGACGHGLWAFLKHYIFKLGFIDGWAGFVIAFGNFEGTFYRYAKRYEETQDWTPPPSEPLRREAEILKVRTSIEMNIYSNDSMGRVAGGSGPDSRPILIVPYMWIGDFVRCHSVVQMLRMRFPTRPIDMLATTRCAPLADYMPGLRQAIVVDLPRGRIALAQQAALAKRLKRESYGTALVMPRTWKSTLAPFFAGIPERIGFVGEARFILLNDLRFGERKLPRMVDRCAALTLPAGAKLPAAWPEPELKVTPVEVATWRNSRGLADGGRPIVALAPGAVGPSKRWPSTAYAALARGLLAEGFAVWVLGGPDEKPLAGEIVGDTEARDLTSHDLREAILALASASVAVSNDSGLLHVAAALGRPTIGIFGPTSPWHWAPLNPLAATIETTSELACRPCHKPVCRLGHHRCMRDIAPEAVIDATRRAVAAASETG